MEKIEATHEITAVTFKDGLAEFSWMDRETGEYVSVSCQVDEETGAKLARIVPACVYSQGVNVAAGNKADRQTIVNEASADLQYHADQEKLDCDHIVNLILEGKIRHATISSPKERPIERR